MVRKTSGIVKLITEPDLTSETLWIVCQVRYTSVNIVVNNCEQVSTTYQQVDNGPEVKGKGLKTKKPGFLPGFVFFEMLIL